MKIILASSDSDEILRAANAGLIDAVALSDAGSLFDSAVSIPPVLNGVVRDLGLPIYVHVGAISADDLYRGARELCRLVDADNVVVEIPLVEDAIEPIHRLNLEGVSVCATHVFSAAQALIAAKAGAASIMIGLEDAASVGTSGVDSIATIRAALDASDAECDVLATTCTTATTFVECIVAGAKGVCLTSPTLWSLAVHPLTDRTVDRMLSRMSRGHALRE